mgnify:CR=1 FL=1
MLEFGKYYHIFNRGNNRENLFYEEKNYNHFLKLYGYYIEPVADTFAYCLMKNHFHLLVRIRDEEEIERLVKFQKLDKSLKPLQQFKNFFISYAKAINKAYNRTGSLFQRPFKQIEITSDTYFARLIHYIHFNPQKHRFTNDYTTYRHSSYQLVISDKPTALNRKAVLNWFGGKEEFIQFHRNVADEKGILKLISEDE